MMASQTQIIVIVATSLALAGPSPWAEAEGRSAPSIKKHEVERLTPIPDRAEIVFAAPWAKTKSKFGFVSKSTLTAAGTIA